MIIAGIGDVTHDSSVYLLKNTKILSAIETERLSRVKHGLRPDPTKYTIHEQGTDFQTHLPSCQDREEQHLRNLDYCLSAAQHSRDDLQAIFVSSLFKEPVFSRQAPIHAPIHCLEASHHLIHAASSFYTSPFDSAAILAIDGYGYVTPHQTSDSVLFAQGKGSILTPLKTIQGSFHQTLEEKSAHFEPGHMIFNDSLGVFYQNITMLLGLGYFNEGKTMGLSAYGRWNPTFASLEDHITLLPGGNLRIDNRSIFERVSAWIESIRKTHPTPEKQFPFWADLAFMHQHWLEKMIFHLCRGLYDMTGESSLCLTGGVALNSVANGKILAHTPFNAIHVIPPTGDNGIGLGAALYGAHYHLGLPRKPLKKFSPYLGKRYSNVDIALSMKHTPEFTRLPNPLKLSNEALAAKLLAEGHLLAWFHGRSEIGPRALGSRSLLADPRSSSIRDYVNANVKKREFFRPFAPACLAEEAEKYFSILPHSENGGLPFMLEIREATPLALETIPAVIHTDGTARVQIIDPETHPEFHALVVAFKAQTGVGVVLNTSFNGAHEPMVETPEEAIQCVLKWPVDVIFMNGEGWIKTQSLQTVLGN
jgi:carbamoyltransferase